MASNKSIGERMRKRSVTLEKRRDLALAWAIEWGRQHEEVLAELHRAVGADDRLGPLIGRLQVMYRRKLDALPNVIRLLADPDVPTDAPGP